MNSAGGPRLQDGVRRKRRRRSKQNLNARTGGVLNVALKQIGGWDAPEFGDRITGNRHGRIVGRDAAARLVGGEHGDAMTDQCLRDSPGKCRWLPVPRLGCCGVARNERRVIQRTACLCFCARMVAGNSLRRASIVANVVPLPARLRRHPEPALELTVEVFLAAIAEIERNGFDLHTRPNLHRAEPHSCPGDVFVNGHAHRLPKQPSQVRGLAFERCGEHPERQSLPVILVNLIEHALDVILSGRRRTCHVHLRAPRSCKRRSRARNRWRSGKRPFPLYCMR
jgi:hypothetical protein